MNSIPPPREDANQEQVQVDRIEANPRQPRRHVDEDELKSLSDSIREHGILQPLVVRRNGERYQLIAGERRLRAAQSIGLNRVPVMVVDFNDQQVLEAALVENIQRTDLNPVEKALGFKEYLTSFQMTHEELARRLGLARSTITNLLNLLELAPEVQDALRVGQLTTGHAKVLKGVTDKVQQVVLCHEIIARGLSVHASEALIKQGSESSEADAGKPKSKVVSGPSHKTAHVQGIEDELRQKLATKLEIRVKGKERGQIIISFENNDEFDRLLGVLRG